MFAFNSLFASQNQLYSRRSPSTLSLAFNSVAGFQFHRWNHHAHCSVSQPSG